MTRDVTVPGPDDESCPTIPLAAVTAVGVHPTHRRRGILRRLMAEMLDDGRRRGEPAAGLIASEAPIYGRFGFGQATAGATVVVSTGRSGFFIDAPRLDLRIIDVDEGFTSYRPHPVDNIDGFDQARLEVRDLMGATPETEAGLWRYLLDVDLVTEVAANRRAVEDPVRWRMSDPRRWRTRAYSDMLWLRPLDVPVLLEGRAYTTPGQLVIDVVAPPDPGAPTEPVGTGTGADHPGDDDVVAGRWSVEAGPDGVSVRRARQGQAAELHLGVAELGALYLGGIGATTLAAAGRVVEERAGALRLADRLFAATPSPLSSTGF
ncbi:MAG: GNAT family N-acetyltransferase [Actinomycetota bacterium]|nr:GNAT family N-acetyltransferase [Actinomycetota bacterium]